ncbi:MAG: hypothetical protein DCC55_26290, partial [Chloroflexi bacterium]
MSGLTTLALREQSAYQRDEIDSLKARVRLLETQELPFVSRLRIDAKGDLFAGTADNAYARLPVGSNGDLLIADSTQTTGLRWGAATAAVISDFAEAAQDAVGAALLDSATIDFTYNDGAGTITAIVIDGSISNAKLRNSAALSVIGRSANSTGSPADIVASTDGHVLRRSGTSLGFGQIVAEGIADNAIVTAKILNANVTNAKLANMAQASVKGRQVGAGTGAPEDLTAAQLNLIVGSANLSLGNTSAAYPLHVGAGTDTPTFSVTPTIYAAAAGNTHVIIRNTSGPVETVVSSTTAGVVGTATSHTLALITNNTTRLAIMPGGNVGISNNSPGHLLHVGGGGASSLFTSTTGVIVGSRAGTSGLSMVNSSDSVEAIVYAAPSSANFGSGTNHSVFIRTNNTIRVSILATGNVGIGQGSPGHLLH